MSSRSRTLAILRAATTRAILRELARRAARQMRTQFWREQEAISRALREPPTHFAGLNVRESVP